MSQQDQIVVRLREMILNGELAPGQRLREVDLSESLQVSRTPVRRAIRVLEGEGLVAGSGARECRVRAFTFADMVGAIEIRGALEGYAARRAAMRGLGEAGRMRLLACLETGDRLLHKGMLVSGDAEVFAAMNVQFHDTIVQAAALKALSHAMALNDGLPFAGAGAVALKLDTAQARAQQFALICTAQQQHCSIFTAITSGQAARAEALVREHAFVSIENMKLVIAARGSSVSPPSASHARTEAASKALAPVPSHYAYVV